MRVINRHAATVCGVPSGAEGDVDPSVPGVWVQLQAGHLVPCDGAALPAEKPGASAVDPRDARIRELEAQLAAQPSTSTPSNPAKPATPKG